MLLITSLIAKFKPRLRPTEKPVWAAKSNQGLVRKNNEDFLLSRPDLGLWLVCDGMGGHAGGELASSMAAETIVSRTEAGDDLEQAVLTAHQKVQKLEVEESGARRNKNPGSTVVGLQFSEQKWHMAWVGDSRGWHMERGRIKQISHDQTVVQKLVDWGDITPEEALKHPDRHHLSQVLGQQEDAMDVGMASGDLFAGDVFLLATDGLAFWNKPKKLAAIISNTVNSAEQIIDQLIADSLAQGGKDNVTCVLVKI